MTRIALQPASSWTPQQVQPRGLKRPAQNFNNGVGVVKRTRTRGGAQARPAKPQTQVKKDNKDECVVLDDSEKKP